MRKDVIYHKPLSFILQIEKAQFSCPTWFPVGAKSLIHSILDPNPATVSIGYVTRLVHLYALTGHSEVSLTISSSYENGNVGVSVFGDILLYNMHYKSWNNITHNHPT